jgi:mono/diheme cytochrome c family protein
VRTRKALASMLASAAIAAGAATVLALPWTHDMSRGRAVEPQTMMLVPPPNTLAIGRQPVMDRIEADGRLTNPIAASPEVLQQGHALFDTYCAVCHGADGHGQGPVGKYFSGIPNLSATAIQTYSDGLIYSIIREGGFSMPGYAETLSPAERWALVHMIRTFRQPS